jgi:hypothetical protein
MQITNVFWTMIEVGDNANLPVDIEVLMLVVPVVALIVFVMNLPSVARELAQVRITAPPRVLEEDAAARPSDL